MPTPPPTSFTQTLLSRAHSPASTTRILTDKLHHKPLPLFRPTPTPSTDARTLRRAQRAQKATELQRRRGKQKPRPLSANEKRRLCVYEIPKEERRWAIYEGLHALWCGYMRGILGMPEEAGPGEEGVAGGSVVHKVYVTSQGAGPVIASADFHGAEVEVVRSRCVSRVGVRGIVVRDTKFTFVVITKRDEIKVLPKEHSVFRFEIPVGGSKREGEEEGGEGKRKSLVFELHGSQFENRAPERASKKFKMHITLDL